jgi:hypothetical protein
MGRKWKKRVIKKIDGKNFKAWTREGRKSSAIAEKKALKNQNKKNQVRVVKATGAAGRAGFYDVFLRRKGKQRRRF